MTQKQKTYTFGDIIIREVKSRYYVYLSRASSTDGKEHYIGPLDDVFKNYEKLKLGGWGVSPTSTVGPLGFEPRITTV
ncbi:putative integrase [Acidianus manzaensis]|uniref:ORF D-335-like domain-containing protein n=1 Tax=Acidianus manzaensis TaxID=282676 RepID=A0A1W6K3R0_9CREN|nr:putative integrase [Acidianus manzaensis]ARM77125.1 hypothetical protein B6F84_08245 [Acidianus manzaensis]